MLTENLNNTIQYNNYQKYIIIYSISTLSAFLLGGFLGISSSNNYIYINNCTNVNKL